jgi:hypothetical protein
LKEIKTTTWLEQQRMLLYPSGQYRLGVGCFVEAIQKDRSSEVNRLQNIGQQQGGPL